LHAKTVIIDSIAMYLGSANLTGAGLGAKADGKRNFEMGIWTQSSDLIDAVLEQFNALWEGRNCVGCRRKDVCPVPLEEPSL
jgi:phosphatidylserine/phosphatidylglycerophosphate/cardiolipin synthase-like enzyme